MFGYILTAIISATVTMIVMACFQVGKDPIEDIQQIQPPRHEPLYNEPPHFTAEQFDVVNLCAECFLNYEEIACLCKPDPKILIVDKVKRQLADSLWEYAIVTQCDDRKNCRTHYLVNVKVLKPTMRNPLA